MRRAYLATKPHVASYEADAEAGGHLLKVGFSNPIPPEFALIVGDICGNLRASLDFCWMGLVRAHLGPTAAKATLPITTNRKGIVSMVGKAEIGAAREKAERLLLDTVKPYSDVTEGGNTAICTLNELSNRNKHNWLILQLGRTTLPVMRDQFGNTYDLRATGGVGNVIRFGPGFEPKLEYDGEPTAEIVFGNGMSVKDKPVVPTVINLAQATRNAVEAFVKEFPGN